MKKREPRIIRKPASRTPTDLTPGQLVDGPTLLEILFPEKCRPTLRWLRDQQAQRHVPFIKVGRLVFFDPTKVREQLETQNP
jgi:hypothetical protein